MQCCFSSQVYCYFTQQFCLTILLVDRVLLHLNHTMNFDNITGDLSQVSSSDASH